MVFDLPTYLNGLTALFVVIDPIGAALVFHALVPADDMGFRVKMAIKAVVISTVLLLVFGNFGEPLLEQLGISIHALRISGGLLLFYTAFKMITQEMDMQGSTGKQDISVFPLSIPMLAGPGSLTLSILLFSNAQVDQHSVSVIAAVVSISLFTLVLMLASKWVKTIIGQTGDEILRRFLGVILAALAIQFVHDGIVNFV